jgi:DNA-binding NarL/FixJ family response regulator
MTQKTIRILIADQQHLRRLHIEKMLNQLGCHRIATLNSFEEVVAATLLPGTPFDLVIINMDNKSQINKIKHYCRNNPLIRKAVFYYNELPELQANHIRKLY